MKAGKLRHRVDIQKWVADRDTTTGEVAETWITNTTEWADVRPISGRERMEAAGQQPLSEMKGLAPGRAEELVAQLRADRDAE